MLEHSTSSRNRSGQERKPRSASVLFEDLQAANQPGKRIPIRLPHCSMPYRLPVELHHSLNSTQFKSLEKGRYRKRGKVQAKVNFLRFVSYGDEEVNIRYMTTTQFR